MIIHIKQFTKKLIIMSFNLARRGKRLKKIGISFINLFPGLKLRLKDIVKVESSMNRKIGLQRLDELSPHAKQIYQDLINAMSKKNKNA